MLFNTIQYIFFLPLMVVVYYLIPSTKYRNIWLLAGSYFFYMNWNAAYALLLLTATMITYIGGILQKSFKDKGWEKHRKITLILCLMINLGILCTFKYLKMIVTYINVFLSATHLPELLLSWSIVLPVGISFFTLQSIGYLIDVYRGDISVERNFITYALFVSFFPQLVAGPIERSKNLLVQLKRYNIFHYEFFQKGLYWILYGLMIKMVIADNLAAFVDLVYSDPATYSGWYIVAATFAFSIQIYCDFYGYSIIAKGSAYLFGIELMSNFEAPYFSKSVKEFWRRWHISLSTWFRDYIYIPLGGNRKGEIKKNCNLLIVFLVSGLWHGASIAFVLWGMLHGIYQIIGNLFKYFINEKNASSLFCRKVIKTIFTFSLVSFTWMLFRAGSWAELKDIAFNMMANLGNYNIFTLGNIKTLWGIVSTKMGYGTILGIMILFFLDYQKYMKKSVIDILVKQDVWFRYFVCVGLVLFILNCGRYGETYNPAQFIYFQF